MNRQNQDNRTYEEQVSAGMDGEELVAVLYEKNNPAWPNVVASVYEDPILDDFFKAHGEQGHDELIGRLSTLMLQVHDRFMWLQKNGEI